MAAPGLLSMCLWRQGGQSGEGYALGLLPEPLKPAWLDAVWEGSWDASWELRPGGALSRSAQEEEVRGSLTLLCPRFPRRPTLCAMVESFVYPEFHIPAVPGCLLVFLSTLTTPAVWKCLSEGTHVWLMSA